DIRQGTADKSDIVRRPASAAGLRYEQGNAVQVILTRLERLDHLTGHDYGRITGIVVYILQAGINCLRVNIGKNDKVESRVFKGMLQQPEMDRRHLRSEDGVPFFHLFGK